MERLSPSERVLIAHCLFLLLSRSYRTGEISIVVSFELTLHFTPQQIRTVIDKMDIFEKDRDIIC